MSKWVKAIPSKTNDNKVVIKVLKENIFSRFGTPLAIISDNGTHFYNRSFETLMRKYAITEVLRKPKHTLLTIDFKTYTFRAWFPPD